MLKALDGEVTLTKDPCCITGDNDNDEWRAKMKCGHVFSVESMKNYASSALGSGSSQFCCSICKAAWSYKAMRHVIASGSSKVELEELDQKLNENGLCNETEIVKCPRCNCMCQRVDINEGANRHNRVTCNMCTANGRPNCFCWSCSRPWIAASSSSTCGNEGCDGLTVRERRNSVLAKCPTKSIDSRDQKAPMTGVPELRACLRCNELIHHTVYCKHMTCSRCDCSFCFVCLKPTVDGEWQCGGAYDVCPVAPRQVFPIKKLETSVTVVRQAAPVPAPRVPPHVVAQAPPPPPPRPAVNQANTVQRRAPAENADMILLRMMMGTT